MLMVLAVLSVVRPAGWVGSSYLQVKDMPRTIMRLEVAKTMGLLVAMFALGKLGGPLWACAAVGVAFAANSLSYMWVIRAIDGISLRAQLLPLVPPLVATIPMAFAVLAMRRFWAWFDPPWVPMLSPILPTVVEVIAGAVAFVPSAMLIAPSTTNEVIKLLKTSIRRRAQAELVATPPSAERG
jgi:lipopolysaccharide exporter